MLRSLMRSHGFDDRCNRQVARHSESNEQVDNQTNRERNNDRAANVLRLNDFRATVGNRSEAFVGQQCQCGCR